MSRRIAQFASAAALAVGLIVGQASAEEATQPKKPDTATFIITAEKFARSEFYVHEFCSIDLFRIWGTAALQSRVEIFCKAVEAMTVEYDAGLDVCREKKEARQRELNEKAGTLDEGKKTDMDVRIQIQDGTCQNLVILGHRKKIGAMFGEHFGEITLTYSAPQSIFP